MKTYKDRTRSEFIAASPPGGAFLGQVVLIEEGPNTDQVDITKLQQLAITLLLVIAYVATGIHALSAPGLVGPKAITSLPTFDTTFVTLLGLSSVAYVGGKVPNRGQSLMPPAVVPAQRTPTASSDAASATAAEPFQDPLSAPDYSCVTGS